MHNHSKTELVGLIRLARIPPHLGSVYNHCSRTKGITLKQFYVIFRVKGQFLNSIK
jgi:hypothetical protein